MNNHQFHLQQDHHLLMVSGDLTLKTVQSVLNASRLLVSKGEVNTIDFSKIVNVDSAAMALLIEWKRLNKNIKFNKLPDQLNNLLKMSNAREIEKS